MVSFNSRNSPRTSTVIFFAKCPFATVVVTDEILDRNIAASECIAPRLRSVAQRCALGDSAFLPDHAHNASQLLRHALIRSDHIVERVRDLACYTRPSRRQSRGKITAFESH